MISAALWPAPTTTARRTSWSTSATRSRWRWLCQTRPDSTTPGGTRAWSPAAITTSRARVVLGPCASREVTSNATTLPPSRTGVTDSTVEP